MGIQGPGAAGRTGVAGGGVGVEVGFVVGFGVRVIGKFRIRESVDDSERGLCDVAFEA
jgi:hypothetical protein